jgi:hypothetical protein
LPVGSSFPGVESAGDTTAALRGSKKVVYFATAGDKGMLRLWRSDTGTCVYQQKQVCLMCVVGGVGCGIACCGGLLWTVVVALKTRRLCIRAEAGVYGVCGGGVGRVAAECGCKFVGGVL